MEKEIEFTKVFSSLKKATKGFSNFWLFKKTWLVTLVLILIPLILSILVRMPPATLPVTDTWAQQTVYNSIQNSIIADINKQHPTLPDAQKQELLDTTFQQTLDQHKVEINAEIAKYSAYFKSQLKDQYNYTYMTGIDEYAYYRKAQNVLKTGHIYDKLNNGVPWNDHMIAPLGTEMFFNLHPYIIAYWYKFVSHFGVKDLMGSTFWIPIIFSALSIIPIFFLGKRFAGNIGGFVAAVLLAVSAPVISRTAGGFADTDAYNVFFPLLVAWLFIEAFQRRGTISKIIFASLAGLSVGIFSLIWEWWFIFDLLFVVIIGYFAFNIVKSLITRKQILDKEFKNNALAGLTFIVVSGFFVSLFKGVMEFYNGFFLEPISYYFLKSVATFTVWPNVMTTVAEQNALTVAKVLSAMGGTLFFFTALVGIYLTAFNLKKLSRKDWIMLLVGFIYLFVILFLVLPEDALLFDILVAIPYLARFIQLLWSKEHVSIEFSALGLIWLLFTFFASVRGVRFTLLLAPMYAIGFGVAIGKLFEVVHKSFSKGLSIGEGLSKVLITIVLLLLLFNPFNSPVKTGYNTVRGDVPLINDAWVTALTKIKNESATNAIINSWWDYGHWFKTFADRAVTFDGASQNSPMAHWIGRVLLTDDELEAAGILRMLDCGSNTAFEVLNGALNDTPKSVSILYKIVEQSKSDAAATLKSEGVKQATIDKVLTYTHCAPPEDYFITSADMVDKSGVWAHFGSWNFVRASMYHDVSPLEKDPAIKLLAEKYNVSQEQALRLFSEIKNIDADQWIAPWPGYASDPVKCTAQNDKLLCTHSVGSNTVLPFEINLKSMNVSIQTKDGKVFPDQFVYTSINGGFIEKNYSKNTIGLSLNLIPSETLDGTYTSELSQGSLATSIFTKLFFYSGKDLKCFSPFSKGREFTGGNLFVWKLNWSCLPS